MKSSETITAASFGFASSNFYAEFLAILELERDYRKHFGELMTDDPIESVEFAVLDNIRLEAWRVLAVSRKPGLASLNPGLTDWVVSGAGLMSRVASGSEFRQTMFSKCRRAMSG